MADYGSDVYFDGNNIASISGVVITNRKVADIPNRDLKMGKVARADKSVLTSAEYGSKEIVFEGLVSGTTGRSNTELVIASMLSLLQEPNKELRFERFGFDITYTATLSGYTTDFKGGNCIFSLTFIATDPLAYENTNTQLIQPTNIVASTNTSAIVVDGSYKAAPVFTITISSVTGTSSSYITINNNSTGSGITVTRTWSAGEILIINCLTRKVTVSGVEVAFTGLFPSFNIGSSNVGYIDNFTARSVVLSAVYQRRYV